MTTSAQLSTLNTSFIFNGEYGEVEGNISLSLIFPVLFPNISLHQKPLIRDCGNYDARTRQIFQIPCVHLLPFPECLLAYIIMPFIMHFQTDT